MTAAIDRRRATRGELLRVQGLCVSTPQGRPLLRDLEVSLGYDRVAIFGRNGAGKSTLLEILAGHVAPPAGTVAVNVRPRLVRQEPEAGEAARLARRWLRRSNTDAAFAERLAAERSDAGLRPLATLIDPERLSRGEVRKLHLLAVRLDAPELLLLDEPTEDLDEAGVRWLLRWLHDWPHGLVVVSHDRRLLQGFEHFFVVAESGCRYLPGSFAQVRRQLEREQADRQQRYVEHLGTLADQERHHEVVSRRRQRKKNRGRVSELDRCTPKSRLNRKRSYAQQSQARAKKIREARIGAVRTWARAARRALSVALPLEGVVPTLPPDDGHSLVELHEVGVVANGRRLFEGLDLSLGRVRLGLVGPNGAGKTTLLRVMVGDRDPTHGTARRCSERIGTIAQGATDWQRDEDLVTCLLRASEEPSLDAVAQRLCAHRFPLALAERPLRSLSPGERVRAALLCLFERRPAVELLVLDEPTRGLDFVGQAALVDALRAWPGGLMIASHDRGFLASVGIDRFIELDGHGGYQGVGQVVRRGRPSER